MSIEVSRRDFRVVKVEENFVSNSRTYFEILEVSYDKDGLPIATSESYNLLYGSTYRELTETYAPLAKAFSLPVLMWNKELKRYVEVEK